MLASIHPLGERARHNRWLVTAGSYLLGSVAAAAAFGAALGAAGAAARAGLAAGGEGRTAVALLAGGLCGLGGLAEAFPAAVGLPTAHRQVNEDWLGRYRGWVYGTGFGVQLGLGVVTIVTTAAVYVTLALAGLAGWAAGSVAGGALDGAVVVGSFGLVRALPLLAAGGLRRPHQLHRAHRTLDGAAPAARAVAAAGLVATAAGVLLTVLR